jgi:methionine-rich copper-binding protein CopC
MLPRHVLKDTRNNNLASPENGLGASWGFSADGLILGDHESASRAAAQPADTSAPKLTASTPKDNATAVAVGINIALTFSEPVKAGSGNIVISNGAGDTRTIAVTDASQVTITNNTVTINSTKDLNFNDHYSVKIASSAIKDLAGNTYAGIADATTLDFSTPDTIKPTLISSTPKDNTTEVAVGNNLVLTFSEPVQAGSGNIVISNGAGDTRTIAVTDASQITIKNNTVTINPTKNLNANSHYSVKIVGGVIKDLAGNAYAGLADATALGFSTTDTIPTLISSTPKDNATAVAVGNNLVLTFSEPVQAGSGNIVISNGAGDTRTIAVTDASQVTITNNTVTINPTKNLVAN